MALRNVSTAVLTAVSSFDWAKLFTLVSIISKNPAVIIFLIISCLVNVFWKFSGGYFSQFTGVKVTSLVRPDGSGCQLMAVNSPFEPRLTANRDGKLTL